MQQYHLAQIWTGFLQLCIAIQGANSEDDWICKPGFPCYLIQASASITRKQAEEKCLQMNSRLPVPLNEYEVKNLTSLANNDYWLGIYDGEDDGNWGIDLPGRQNVPLSWTFWRAPPRSGLKQQCAYANSNNGKWKDFACELVSNTLVCEKDKPICNAGFPCYYTRSSGDISIKQAKDTCLLLNSTLPVPKNHKENKYVTKLAKSSFWLGITDEVTEGTWKSYPHSQPPNMDLTWANWKTDPPVGGTAKQCAGVDISRNGTWFDLQCNTVLLPTLICEVVENSATPTSSHGANAAITGTQDPSQNTLSTTNATTKCPVYKETSKNGPVEGFLFGAAICVSATVLSFVNNAFNMYMPNKRDKKRLKRSQKQETTTAEEDSTEVESSAFTRSSPDEENETTMRQKDAQNKKKPKKPKNIQDTFKGIISAIKQKLHGASSDDTQTYTASGFETTENDSGTTEVSEQTTSMASGYTSRSKETQTTATTDS